MTLSFHSVSNICPRLCIQEIYGDVVHVFLIFRDLAEGAFSKISVACIFKFSRKRIKRFSILRYSYTCVRKRQQCNTLKLCKMQKISVGNHLRRPFSGLIGVQLVTESVFASTYYYVNRFCDYQLFCCGQVRARLTPPES